MTALQRNEEVKDGDIDWGNDGSSFSTDFSGFSAYDRSLSPGSDEDGHGYPEPPAVQHLSTGHKVTGKVIRGERLAGDNTHVTVQIVSWKRGTEKSEQKKSPVIAGTRNPRWGFEFEMPEVKKTLAVEFTVWQDNRKIGTAKRKIQDIELDNSKPFTMQLRDPAGGSDQPEPDGTCGTIEVKLVHRVNRY
jgi:hypothetical protein